MRHCAMGRHRRYRSRSPLLPAALAFTAALALFLGIGGLAGTFSSPAAARVNTAVLTDRGAETAVPEVTASQVKSWIAQIAIQARIRAAAVLAAHTYTVRSGDSISAVAVQHCGQARMWTGIYAASRARGWTSWNANILTAGQHLYLSCAYLPSMLRYASVSSGQAHVVTSANVMASAQAPRSATSSSQGRAQGLSYGHPNFCGDGDGDGWDVACQAAPQHRAISTVSPVAAAITASRPASAGTYSFAGLEALWESAGGPAWAASHAAEIAECESGGRTSAFNPSGATGLWQILGSVVPGNLRNAFTNALNAVSKFRASGDTFAQWVCR